MQNHRFIFLDGMRGLAAFAVVIYHFTLHGGSFGTIFGSANIAVDFFFCLSGFVIALAYTQKLLLNDSKITYIKKRLVRLYPMFLIGLLIGLVSMLIKYGYKQTDYSLIDIFKATILNSLYIPYLNDGSYTIFKETAKATAFPLNSASWSLFYELLANILFIFTVRLSKPALILLTATLGLWLIQNALSTNGTAGWGAGHMVGGFPRVGYSFMVGVLIYKFFGESNPKIALHPALIASFLVLLFLVPRKEHWIYFYLVTTLLILPLVVLLGAKVKIKNQTAERAMEYLGRISYPIYCVHTPILVIISSLYPNPVHFYPFTLVSVIGITLFTHIVMVYVDEPIRARLSRSKGQPEVDSAR